MANEIIRSTAKEEGVRQWEIADELGIHESTLVKKLRHELPQDEKDKIIDAIYRIVKARPDKNAKHLVDVIFYGQ